MKYAPSIWDFENGFFLIDKVREPYFLVSAAGQLLRSNRVGQRYLKSLKRSEPNILERLRSNMTFSPGKTFTTLLGKNRKRILRATPVGAGQGFLIEIDRI